MHFFFPQVKRSASSSESSEEMIAVQRASILFNMGKINTVLKWIICI